MISNEDLITDDDLAIELETYSPEVEVQLPMLGMMVLLICCSAIVSAFRGNGLDPIWIALVAVGIGAAVEPIARWMVAKSTKSYRLLPDRIVIDGMELLLDEIDSIRWPEKRTGNQLLVEIYEKADPEIELHPFKLPLEKLRQKDQLLLVQYLQQVEAEHLDWSEFCCRYLGLWLPVRSERYFSKQMSDRLQRNPFWAAFLWAPYMAFVFMAYLSKFFYFGFGVALAISAVINIRLMHGSWLSPIGETILGAAALLFLFGVIISFFPQLKTRRELEPAERKAGLQAIVILVLGIIFGPLVSQLLIMNGWKLPALLVMQLSPFVPCLPFILQQSRKLKERKENPEACFERAMEKWNRYCEYGPEEAEPYSSSAIHSGNFSTGNPTTVDSRPSTMRTQSSPS